MAVLPQASSVLIVDDDETITTLLRDYVEAQGTTDILIALDGDTAWRLVREKAFRLVVLDWRVPGVSGLALFNRIRQLPGYELTPICISSGLLTREDCLLLEEYPVTCLLEKPYSEQIFVACIGRLMLQSQWHEANQLRMKGIVAGIRAKDSTAVASLQSLLRSSPSSTSIAISAAKLMRQSGQPREAEAMLNWVIEKDSGSILAQFELGKVLHEQGRFAEALGILNRVQELSPKNLHRLCLIGEIELVTGDAEGAARHFKQALVVDRDDPKAAAGLATAENIKGMPPELRSPPDLLKSIAGLINLTAISLIKKGDHEAAVQQYLAAFHFTTSDEDRARIAFNLGLAYFRRERLDDATTWFQKANDFSGGTFGKARDYLTRLAKRKALARPSTEPPESMILDIDIDSVE